jgi:hypothetical protein
MLMKIEHFKPPFLLKILYWISYTHTHRDYGEGSYNVIKDGKEAIQGGKSEALKLLLLISKLLREFMPVRLTIAPVKLLLDKDLEAN